MKITMYELLGLVKDGKAPKKIAINGIEIEYDKDIKDYYPYYNKCLFEYKFSTCKNFLNDEVEIIEEPKKIEKISWREKESLAGDFTASEKQKILARRTEKLKSSLNELIDEINKSKKGEK